MRRLVSVLLISWLLLSCSEAEVEGVPDDNALESGPFVGRPFVTVPDETTELLGHGTWIVEWATVGDIRLSPMHGTRLVLQVDEDGQAVSECVIGDLLSDELLPDGTPLHEWLGFVCGNQGTLSAGMRRVRSAQPFDGGVVLIGDGVELRVKEPVPVNDEFFDREWRLAAWVPSTRRDPFPAVAPSTLTLYSDGRVEGTSGCGASFSGRWERVDDLLAMPLFDISSPCDDGDEMLVDQHGWVTSMGVGIRPRRLEDGRMAVALGSWRDQDNLIYE